MLFVFFLLDSHSFVPFTSACPPPPFSLYILPCVLQCLWGHEIAPQLLGISCAVLLRLPSLTCCLLCLSVSHLFFCISQSQKRSFSICLCISNHYLSVIILLQPSQCTVGPVHHNINSDEQWEITLMCKTCSILVQLLCGMLTQNLFTWSLEGTIEHFVIKNENSVHLPTLFLNLLLCSTEGSHTGLEWLEGE